MEVTIQDGFEGTKDYYLHDGDKELRILFGGNLDLYWHFINYNENSSHSREEDTYDTFSITKENYTIYSLFKKLIEDIKTCNVFEPSKEKDLDYFEDIFGEKETPEQRCARMNKELQRHEEYGILYDGESIIWRSDDECFDIASRVIITEVDDTILLEFFRPGLDKEQQRLYDNYFAIKGEVGIRFRNSGSMYTPLNVIFMRMYNALQEYDPDYHQVHIEEIEYQKKLTK